MSITVHTSSADQRNPARRKPRMTVAQLFLGAVQRWQRSRAIAALERLSDRQLEDIGVARNDIPRVVEGLFHPEEAPSGPRAQGSTPEERMRQLA